VVIAGVVQEVRTRRLGGGRRSIVTAGVRDESGSVRAALTFVELVTDGAGSVVATVTLSATVRVDETGDAMTGPYSVTSVGPDGQPLPDSGGTLQGTRIKIALIADFSGSQDAGKLDVAFLDKSSGDPAGWTWDFGDGHAGTRQDPTHTYAKAGDYQVKLTASNDGGSDSQTTTVTVKPVPPAAADFTSKQDAGTLDVRFSDSSTGKPTRWSWDFGDGHVVNRQNPTHTYAKARDYQVKLTIKGVGGSDSKTRTVTVDPVRWVVKVAVGAPVVDGRTVSTAIPSYGEKTRSVTSPA